MAILRNKTHILNGYGGTIDNVFKLNKTSNLGKLFYFNFESLSDISAPTTINLFTTTASGTTGNNYIDLTSGQSALNFTYQDAYITISGNSYVISSVDESIGRIFLYSNLVNSFTDTQILFNRISTTGLVNRFSAGYNSYTGSSVFYIYKIDNIRWTLRSYNSASFTLGFNANNATLPSLVRRVTCYNDFRLKKSPYSNTTRVISFNRGAFTGSSNHTIEQGSGYNDRITIVSNIANQASLNLPNDKGEFLLPRKYANIYGLVTNENNTTASGNRVLIQNDVVSTSTANGITSASALVAYSRDTTTQASTFSFGGLNISTSPLYTVYTEFSFILAMLPIEDYTMNDIIRQVSYIRKIFNVY